MEWISSLPCFFGLLNCLILTRKVLPCLNKGIDDGNSKVDFVNSRLLTADLQYDLGRENHTNCEILISNQNSHARIICVQSSYNEMKSFLTRYAQDTSCPPFLELIIDNGNTARYNSDYNLHQMALQDINMALLHPVKPILTRLLIRNFFRDLVAEISSGALSGLEALQVIKLEDIVSLKMDWDWLPDNMNNTLESVLMRDVTFASTNPATFKKILNSPRKPCLTLTNVIFPCSCSYEWVQRLVRKDYSYAKPFTIFSKFDGQMSGPFGSESLHCGFVKRSDETQNCISLEFPYNTESLEDYLANCKKNKSCFINRNKTAVRVEQLQESSAYRAASVKISAALYIVIWIVIAVQSSVSS